MESEFEAFLNTASEEDLHHVLFENLPIAPASQPYLPQPLIEDDFFARVFPSAPTTTSNPPVQTGTSATAQDDGFYTCNWRNDPESAERNSKQMVTFGIKSKTPQIIPSRSPSPVGLPETVITIHPRPKSAAAASEPTPAHAAPAVGILAMLLQLNNTHK